jgi:hypothetical protein
MAVCWHLRFNLSYRDVEELFVERGVRPGRNPRTARANGNRSTAVVLIRAMTAMPPPLLTAASG